MPNAILIYGAGGFAREVKDLVDDVGAVRGGIACAGFLDDRADGRGTLVDDVPVLGGEEIVAEWKDRALFLVGIGSPPIKKKVADRVSRSGGGFAVAVHPTAVKSRYVELGEGTIVTAGVILTNRIRIGRHVILNLGVTVGHDCVLEDYVTVAPGARISGNVRVGEGTDIGTGASVIQGVTIGRWSVVGAGAVVTKDLPDNCTAVGIPAKVIKTREEGWHLA